MRKLLHWPYWMEVVRLATFTIVTALLFLAITSYINYQHNQNALLKEIKASDQLIIGNQTLQSQGTKIYINCLVHIDPNKDVQPQLDNCFNGAPKLRK